MGFISPISTDTNGVEKTTGGMQSLGKNDFLQLLVTKLQNQDPLNPAEDEDFIAQLAQFSSLEQMNNIADGISTSNEWDFLQMQSLNNVMASGLIGKDIKAEYSSVYVEDNNSPQITYTLNSPADEVTFVIRDAYGTVVNTISQNDVTTGVNSMTWDGTDRMGNRVDDGAYYIEASATNAAGLSSDLSLSLVGTVEAVIYREGTAYLKVNGTEVPLGDVSAIGEAGSYTGDNGEDA